MKSKPSVNSNLRYLITVDRKYTPCTLALFLAKEFAIFKYRLWFASQQLLSDSFKATVVTARVDCGEPWVSVYVMKKSENKGCCGENQQCLLLSSSKFRKDDLKSECIYECGCPMQCCACLDLHVRFTVVPWLLPGTDNTQWNWALCEVNVAPGEGIEDSTTQSSTTRGPKGMM